jgi:hypothetical protein
MWLFSISGNRFEIFKGTPVLYKGDSSPIEEDLPSQKPLLRMLEQRAHHRHHSAP